MLHFIEPILAPLRFYFFRSILGMNDGKRLTRLGGTLASTYELRHDGLLSRPTGKVPSVPGKKNHYTESLRELNP
jgi:hypothetical protein